MYIFIQLDELISMCDYLLSPLPRIHEHVAVIINLIKSKIILILRLV